MPELNVCGIIKWAGHFGTVLLLHLAVNPITLLHQQKIMGNLLYVIAVILVIAWAIGYFGYQAGGIIHVLLVIAIIAVLLKVIRRA